jgi:hypothetical protein
LLGLTWTYLRLYGSGDRYSMDLYRPHDGTDTIEFVKAAEGVPNDAVGEYSLTFNREELDKLIAELVWRRDNWGKTGRG